MNPQEDEWLSGYAGEPLCTVLSNNHNFHLTGKWYDEKCSKSGYGFVCQKPQGKIPSLSWSLVSFLHCHPFIATLSAFQHVCLSLFLSGRSNSLMLNGLSYTCLITYSLCTSKEPLPWSGNSSSGRCFIPLQSHTVVWWAHK